MARYSISMNKDTTSVLQIGGYNNSITLPRRSKVYDYMVGNGSTPADNFFNHELLRVTADPTSTNPTPQPLDPADAASLFVGNDVVTVDAAGTVVMMRLGLNQRATYRWVAAPGSEIVTAATDNLGIFGRLDAATTSEWAATMLVDEQ